MIKERIIKILEYKGIPKEDFYVKIGMTSANFRGKAKSTPLNSNAIENILSEIPDINPEWLITGKGNMLNSSNSGLYMGDNNHQINIGSGKLISTSEVPYPKKNKKISDETEKLKHENYSLITENDFLKEKIKLLEKTINDKEYIINMLKNNS